MLIETYLTTQLSYALALNPRRLARVSSLFLWTLFTALLSSFYLISSTVSTLDIGYFEFNAFGTSLKLLVLATVIFLLTTLAHSGSEVPFMITLATLFLHLMLSSNHFVVTFFAVVGFSLNLYILVLFDASFAAAREAGIKYYYLSTFSSGLILFGIFLLFLLTESLDFDMIAATLSLHTFNPSAFLFAGTFLLFGFFFKLSAFPGQQWAPEVYEGSPAAIMGYFMIPVKIAVLGSVMLFLSNAFNPVLSIWQPILVLAVTGSLIWGCFGAFYELKVRRFLAYASINQMGFLLLGLACGSTEGSRATLIYLILYVVMSVAFLNIFLYTYRAKDNQTPIYLTDFRGLGLTNRAAAWTLTVTLLSMAGIPPLAGFFGKYYLLLHAVEQTLYMSAIVGLVTSLVSTYYYLRIIKMLWFEGVGRSPRVAPVQGTLSHVLEAALWGFGLVLSPAILLTTKLTATLWFAALRRIKPSFTTVNSFLPLVSKVVTSLITRATYTRFSHTSFITLPPTSVGAAGGADTTGWALFTAAFLLLLYTVYKDSLSKRGPLPKGEDKKSEFVDVLTRPFSEPPVIPDTASVAPQAILGLMALGSALCVILLASPVHNLLALITSFLCVVGLYISVEVQFIAFTFLIVYVGAVAILFLFVVMLLNVKELSQVVVRGRFPAFAAMFVLAFPFARTLQELVNQQISSDRTVTEFQAFTSFVENEYQDVAVFATLYAEHAPVFILTTLILIATMVGVIVVAKPQHGPALAALTVVEQYANSHPYYSVALLITSVAVCGFICPPLVMLPFRILPLLSSSSNEPLEESTPTHIPEMIPSVDVDKVYLLSLTEGFIASHPYVAAAVTLTAVTGCFFICPPLVQVPFMIYPLLAGRGNESLASPVSTDLTEMLMQVSQSTIDPTLSELVHRYTTAVGVATCQWFLFLLSIYCLDND